MTLGKSIHPFGFPSLTCKLRGRIKSEFLTLCWIWIPRKTKENWALASRKILNKAQGVHRITEVYPEVFRECHGAGLDGPQVPYERQGLLLPLNASSFSRGVLWDPERHSGEHVSTCEIEQASKYLQHQNKLQLASTELLVKKVLSIAK